MSIDRVDADGLTDADLAEIRDRDASAGPTAATTAYDSACQDRRALLAEVVRLRTARDEAEAKVAALLNVSGDAIEILDHVVMDTPEDQGLHNSAVNALRASRVAALAVTSPPSNPTEGD